MEEIPVTPVSALTVLLTLPVVDWEHVDKLLERVTSAQHQLTTGRLSNVHVSTSPISTKERLLKHKLILFFFFFKSDIAALSTSE